MTDLVLGPLLRHVGARDATIWVETSHPCEVEVLGHTERTWTMSGHHYALVTIDNLEPDTTTDYSVSLDGTVAWPPPDDAYPHCRIRTLPASGDVTLAFGSCRYARADAVSDDRHFDADALDCLARELIGLSGPSGLSHKNESAIPDALILLGDQVYADETSPATAQRIRQRRDITTGAKDQVADFEEYTWLYHESWTDPDVRWLFSTVPTSMIFDDHDVRDDWNTSHSWREEMARTSWWDERIIGALSSYWVYQHLGNLSPAELAGDELYQRVRGAGTDVEPMLREFAVAADAEADGAKGARWSYRRDFGDVRLVMIDSRCGRILADGARGMVSSDEFDWITDQCTGEFRHLLLGTSLPWLLPRAVHDLEAWNEVLCDGARGARVARWSESLRRAADLEHWAAFGSSFVRLAELIDSVRRGDAAESGVPPATVCVLSGDVHHAYVARAGFHNEDTAGAERSQVYQLTCSPVHNAVPAAMKIAFRLAWSRVAEAAVRRVLALTASLPTLPVTWDRESGPYFGNELMTLKLRGRSAELLLRKASKRRNAPALHGVDRLTLS